MVFFAGQSGQVFSPDLIVALGVFVLTLAFFFSASSSVFSQVDLSEQQKRADEAAHVVLNDLVLSAGEPTYWANQNLSDINAFGLASSANQLDRQKVLYLTSLLSGSNYSATKEKLGLGPYDFKLEFLDGSGAVIVDANTLSAGSVSTAPKVKLVYQRVVYYNSSPATMRATLSLPG